MVVTGCMAVLASCMQYKKPDLSLYESYQITNVSSESITMHFYEQGAPKAVYVEVLDGYVCKNLKPENKSVRITALTNTTALTLSAGQTALLYIYYSNNTNGTVDNLWCNGHGDYIYLFASCSRFVGDSVVASIAGQPDAVLEVKDYSQWETWYDETQFIYYHLWRIQ